VIFTNPKKDEALQNLSAAIHDRAKSGFVPAQPEARLAHAESLINAGTTAAGRAELAALKMRRQRDSIRLQRLKQYSARGRLGYCLMRKVEISATLTESGSHSTRATAR
jgi:hypothetical protein